MSRLRSHQRLGRRRGKHRRGCCSSLKLVNLRLLLCCICWTFTFRFCLLLCNLQDIKSPDLQKQLLLCPCKISPYHMLAESLQKAPGWAPALYL